MRGGEQPPAVQGVQEGLPRERAKGSRGSRTRGSSSSWVKAAGRVVVLVEEESEHRRKRK